MLYFTLRFLYLHFVQTSLHQAGLHWTTLLAPHSPHLALAGLSLSTIGVITILALAVCLCREL